MGARRILEGDVMQLRNPMVLTNDVSLMLMGQTSMTDERMGNLNDGGLARIQAPIRTPHSYPPPKKLLHVALFLSNVPGKLEHANLVFVYLSTLR